MDKREDPKAAAPTPPPGVRPDATTPPPKGSLGEFVFGFLTGLVFAGVCAIIAGAGVMQIPGGRLVPLLGASIDLVVFAILVERVRRTKRRGIIKGLLVGCAVAFLLCAACWGLTGLNGI